MSDTHFAIMMGFIFAAVIVGILEWARRGRSALRDGAVELRAEYEKNLQPGYPFRTVLDAPCPPDNCTKEQIQEAVEKVKVDPDGTVHPEGAEILGGEIRRLNMTGDGEGKY